MSNTLQELADKYHENWNIAVECLQGHAGDPGLHAEALVRATLAQAAATKMLVELFGTGAVVEATVRRRDTGMGAL